MESMDLPVIQPTMADFFGVFALFSSFVGYLSSIFRLFSDLVQSVKCLFRVIFAIFRISGILEVPLAITATSAILLFRILTSAFASAFLLLFKISRPLRGGNAGKISF